MTSKGHGQGDEFDMRPNLNTSQFSQGTLFGGGKRPGRGPKGYTPERMAEVGSALNFKGPISPPSTGIPAGERKGHAAAGARNSQEEIARSTVDMGDLPRDLTVKTLHPDQRGLGTSRAASGTLGMYKTQARGDRRIGAAKLHGTGEILVRETAVDPQRAANMYGVKAYAHTPPGALIHELGHAAHDKVGEGIPWNSQVDVGKAEGTADSFGAKHFHDRRGNTAKFAYPAQGRTNEQRAQFQHGYDLVRGQEPGGPGSVRFHQGAMKAARQQPSLFEDDAMHAPATHPAYKAALAEGKQQQNNANAAQRRQWRKNG